MSRSLTAQLGLDTAAPGIERFLTEAGYFLYASGDFDAAATVLDGACLLAPDDAVPRIARAEVHLAQHQPRRAERAAARACDAVVQASAATLAFAWLVRGDALAASQRIRDGKSAWQRAIDLDPVGAAGNAAAGRLNTEHPPRSHQRPNERSQ